MATMEMDYNLKSLAKLGKVDFRTVKTTNLRNPRDRAPLTRRHILCPVLA